VPSVRDVAANFREPPHYYGAIQPFMSWNGPDANERKARIVADLDRLASSNVFIVNVSPGRGIPAYLSPEHMAQMKFIVQEAKKRDMKIWLQDESDYPSGFAGGKIRQQYPQLGMQGILADIHVRVAPGQTLTMPVPSDTLGIMATETARDQTLHNVVSIPVPANGQLKWTVPNEGSTPNEPNYFHTAHLRQLADAELQSRGRHPRQRRLLHPHRLPGCGGHPRLPQDRA
jgi:hypothetical protein